MKIPLFNFFFIEYPLFPERLTHECPCQYTFSTFLFLSSDDSFGEFLYKNIKKITKVLLAWKKEMFNGYLDGMKTMFRKESPDDARLTWMIEALRAGELSSHVGRVLERKVR